MLQRDGEPALNSRQRHMVEEAEKSCARLVAIVGELSDIAKLDAGSLALARQPIDLFALVDEAASHVESTADRDVHLAVRGDSTGARMSGDSGRLGKALEAIFRAIVREHAGPATVVAERRLDTVDGVRRAVVVVSEESRVPAAYAAQRGEFDDKRGGLGLALPLARRVVEGHGGQLWSPRSTVDGDVLARSAMLVAVPVS
jgi:signal transduction histidine kinase